MLTCLSCDHYAGALPEGKVRAVLELVWKQKDTLDTILAEIVRGKKFQSPLSHDAFDLHAVALLQPDQRRVLEWLFRAGMVTLATHLQFAEAFRRFSSSGLP